jgi:hypothetical protein
MYTFLILIFLFNGEPRGTIALMPDDATCQATKSELQFQASNYPEVEILALECKTLVSSKARF